MVGSYKEVRRIVTHFPLYQASIFSIEFHPIQFSLLIPISSILESCNPARFSLCTISNSPELSENIFNVKKYFQCEKISQLACGSVHGSQGSKNWIINGLVALTWCKTSIELFVVKVKCFHIILRQLAGGALINRLRKNHIGAITTITLTATKLNERTFDIFNLL